MNEIQNESTIEPVNNQVQINSDGAPKSEENQENWKVFREQRKAERQAREEAERVAAQKAEEAAAYKAALEAMTSKPVAVQHEARDESEEDRMEKRIKEIILEREQEYIKERAKKEHDEYPQKLRSAYKDFDKVCSPENLDYLEFHYPEVSTPFKHMPNGFERWAAIYQSVKRFVPNPDSKADAAKADRNLAKPGNFSASGNSHGANAMPGARLDESRKASNWERMQNLLKTAG